MVQHLRQRKGAARIALIPPEVLEALSSGQLPTVNLNEFLAIDLARLARVVAASVGLPADHERIADTLAMLPAFRPVRRHEHIARAFFDLVGEHAERDRIATAFATHPSDVVRGWATQWVQFSDLDLRGKLAAVRPFAADAHFGVREMAWMAVRDEIAGAIDQAVTLLLPWAHDPDANIRRFASEATRPRGVWCAHVEALKAQPWRGLPLLEPLKADGSRYVQDSVANWLNDASRTQPEWVEEVCTRWERTSAGPATAYIVRRARRTMSRGGAVTPP